MSKDIKAKAEARESNRLSRLRRRGSKDSLDSVTTAATTMTRASIVPKSLLCCFGSSSSNRAYESTVVERRSQYEEDGLGPQCESVVEAKAPKVRFINSLKEFFSIKKLLYNCLIYNSFTSHLEMFLMLY